MKCALVNIGTRGDLQPLVSLALAFRVKGWEVLLISEESGRALAEDFGLDFRVVAGDSTKIIFEEEHAEMLAKGKIMAMIQETSTMIMFFFFLGWGREEIFITVCVLLCFVVRFWGWEGRIQKYIRYGE